LRFKKISITKRGVLLLRETKDGNGAAEEVKLESPERPKPSFDEAQQGFAPFVRDLLTDAVDLEDSTLTITTLNLSEDTNGNRGLIVTAIVPVPNAHDKPLVLNTPLVREGNGELNLSDEATTLGDAELKLIKLAEAEAEKYVKGDRLPPSADVEKKPASKNAQEFDEAAAHAENTSTRKPAKGKGKEKDNTVPFPPVTGSEESNAEAGAEEVHAGAIG
jgi:hypothetical protein